MRINRVSIKEYKNLKNFDCTFSGSNVAAFIGNNGSGKSNLLEAITKAFSSAQNDCCGKPLSPIYPGTSPGVLDCVIEYSVADICYTLQYNYNIENLLSHTDADSPQVIREQIAIWRGDKRLSHSEMSKALPELVFLYYAGETQRQKGTAECTYDALYETRLKRAKASDLPGLRFIDCYDTDDLTLLLAAASAYRGDYYRELLNLLGCNDIAPRFSFILKRPGKGKGAADTYWGATGFVRSFLDDLRKEVVATRDLESQYFMFFNDFSVLKKISTDDFDLFAKLKVLKHYGYLDHIGLEFEKCDGTRFSSLRLSEGEKQLTLLLLLTAFTAKKEVLYLFDEFDSYLHLNWQRSIVKMLNEIEVNGHIIFTTHSPASISKMQREDLFIMRDGKAFQPLSDTYNRSLDEIMEEQMEVSLRPQEYTDLVKEFRDAIIHNKKDTALAKLDQIKEIVGEHDPFFITANIALERMS